MRNHDFDKSKLSFKLSGIFRMLKTYAARLPRIYSLIDLTNFIQALKNNLPVLLLKLWLC